MAELLELLQHQDALLTSLWVLVVTFSVSGFMKLRHPFLTAMALVDFRVASRADQRLGMALGVFEVALAIGLASQLFSVATRLVAAVLLWVFVALIARSLSRGESFACFCFGRSDDGLSLRTLARTTFLAAVASLVAVTAIAREADPLPVANQVHYAIVAMAAFAIAVLLARATLLMKLNAKWFMK
jgi:hypothetical protein